MASNAHILRYTMADISRNTQKVSANLTMDALSTRIPSVEAPELGAGILLLSEVDSVVSVLEPSPVDDKVAVAPVEVFEGLSDGRAATWMPTELHNCAVNCSTSIPRPVALALITVSLSLHC